MLEHAGEAGDAAGGQRINRPSADAVHADFLFAQITGQITRAGFQRRLGHAHHVVVRHHAFGAEIAHRHDAAALSH